MSVRVCRLFFSCLLSFFSFLPRRLKCFLSNFPDFHLHVLLHSCSAELDVEHRSYTVIYLSLNEEEEEGGGAGSNARQEERGTISQERTVAGCEGTQVMDGE